MAYTKTYVSQLQGSPASFDNMAKAQRQLWRDAFRDRYNETTVATKLNAFSTVLGLLFILNTPVSVAAATLSIISGNSSSYIRTVSDLVIEGYHGLEEIYDEAIDKGWEEVKVDFPFLEFNTRDHGIIRYVTGQGRVVSFKKVGHWHI